MEDSIKVRTRIGLAIVGTVVLFANACITSPEEEGGVGALSKLTCDDPSRPENVDYAECTAEAGTQREDCLATATTAFDTCSAACQTEKTNREGAHQQCMKGAVLQNQGALATALANYEQSHPDEVNALRSSTVPGSVTDRTPQGRTCWPPIPSNIYTDEAAFAMGDRLQCLFRDHASNQVGLCWDLGVLLDFCTGVLWNCERNFGDAEGQFARCGGSCQTVQTNANTQCYDSEAGVVRDDCNASRDQSYRECLAECPAGQPDHSACLPSISNWPAWINCGRMEVRSAQADGNQCYCVDDVRWAFGIENGLAGNTICDDYRQWETRTRSSLAYGQAVAPCDANTVDNGKCTGSMCGKMFDVVTDAMGKPVRWQERCVEFTAGPTGFQPTPSAIIDLTAADVPRAGVPR